MNIDPNKIKKDIADSQSRKETLLLSLQGDIDAMERDVQELFRDIGARTYKLSSQGQGQGQGKEKFEKDGELVELFAKVDELKAAQAAKEGRKDEIAARYDEEIEIFQKLLPPDFETPAEPDVPETAAESAESAEISVAPAMAEGSPAPEGTPVAGAMELSSGFCMNCGRMFMVGERCVLSGLRNPYSLDLSSSRPP
jgi:hypothetical protein